jgi:hypothetical protein
MTSITQAAPSAQTPRTAQPAPAPVRTKRKPARTALGIALVATAALTAGWYANSVSNTTQVVVTGAEVSRGQQLAAGDLQVIEVPSTVGALATVPGDQIDALVGQFADRDLPANTLLDPAAVAPELSPAAGRSAVGLALTQSQMPPRTLVSGDQVRIVETPVTGGDPPVESPRAISATVVSSELAATGDVTIVEVEVDQAQAADLAARAATGRIALVVDPAGE